MEKEQLVALVREAQKGDNEALNSLFNEFYNDLYYFALKTVKDDEIALDVTQEAFVEIINTLGNLKEPAAFVTWAKQITYHQCTRYFKKKKDVLVDEDEDGNTVFDTLKEENAEFIPDEALDKSDFKKTVMAILDELSEEQRSATMMYYFDEMSVRQIAEIQGVSEGTVKSRLNYARKAIKNSVEEYEKKHNIKLHAIPFFPFFKWLFEGTFEGGIPTVSAEIVAEGVTAATGTTVTVATATATTATVAATATTAGAVGLGAKIAALPLAAKIIAGVVAAAIAIGGGTTAAILSQKDNNDVPADNQSIVSSEDTEIGKKNKELILEGIIPEGCTYTLYDGTVLTAGQNFPEICTAGDKVTYGDYLYGYECIYAKNVDNKDEWYLWKDNFDSGDSGLIESDAFGSWSVMVADQTKTSYGVIASEINGKPIKTLYATFYECVNMTEAPKIPSTITAMTATYNRCIALEKAPVIPSNVERIMMSFMNCMALSGDVVINAKLDKSLEWFYTDTFSGTGNKINLTGETPEEDLILIAKGSNNKNITVNGKEIDYEQWNITKHAQVLEYRLMMDGKIGDNALAINKTTYDYTEDYTTLQVLNSGMTFTEWYVDSLYDENKNPLFPICMVEEFSTNFETAEEQKNFLKKSLQDIENYIFYKDFPEEIKTSKIVISHSKSYEKVSEIPEECFDVCAQKPSIIIASFAVEGVGQVEVECRTNPTVSEGGDGLCYIHINTVFETTK